MKFTKQTLIRALSAFTLLFSVLALIFSGKKKTLSFVFAGFSIAGALANLLLAFSDKCNCNENAFDEFDTDEDFLDASDIYCDFEEDAELDDDGEDIAVDAE